MPRTASTTRPMALDCTKPSLAVPSISVALVCPSSARGSGDPAETGSWAGWALCPQLCAHPAINNVEFTRSTADFRSSRRFRSLRQAPLGIARPRSISIEV